MSNYYSIQYKTPISSKGFVLNQDDITSEYISKDEANKLISNGSLQEEEYKILIKMKSSDLNKDEYLNSITDYSNISSITMYDDNNHVRIYESK
jgi:hypothetical protein